MNNFLYARLAVTNIRKNKSFYLPYLLAGALMVSIFYSLLSVTVMISSANIAGGQPMAVILLYSSFVCGLLSFIILFYINSFIMKRRKKEFGLYSILGMEKRHISFIMAWEVFFSALISITCGIVGGALFSQLFFLLLLQIVGLPVKLTFQVPLDAVAASAILFGAGFLVVLLYGIISICRTDPIALLHSDKQGEHEPKSRWLPALIGAVTLAGGYFISWSVKTSSDAVTLFFPAVILVIIGTYCLFLAGSVVLLKLMRKNKRFYYRPKNFVSVSGMIYRMKQNATGLSNICILSTCLLVTLSSTVCLFVGEEDILRGRYPREIITSCIAEDETSGAILEQAAQDYAVQCGMTVENPLGYHELALPTIRAGSTFAATDRYNSTTCELSAILLDDYNRMTGEALTLAPGEVLVAYDSGAITGGSLEVAGIQYTIAGNVKTPPTPARANIAEGFTMVMSDFSELTALAQANDRQRTDGATRPLMYYYFHDVTGNSAGLGDYYAGMREALLEHVHRLAETSNIDAARDEFYQLYGSLMFVGIFFVALFLIAAILIIYYKQITEGFDDHDRFQIMQKVGMSDHEVRSTISKQVLMMFYLPLGMAVVHIAAAFPVLSILLRSFGMYNTTLFLLCTLGAVLAFTLLYLVVYRLTARTYYRIVQAK